MTFARKKKLYTANVPVVVHSLAILLGAPANVALPPRITTYGDLCAALSTQGVPVQCAQGIANRMAALSLRPRPWPQISTILARALDVEFHLQPDGTLEMRSDAKVRDWERREFDRYASHAEGILRPAMPEVLPLARRFANDEEGNARLLAIARRSTASETKNAVSTAAMLVLGVRNRAFEFDLMPAYVIAEGGLASLVQADALAYGLGEANTFRGDLPELARWKQNFPSPHPRALLVQRTHFDPLDGTIRWTRIGNVSMIVDPVLTRAGIRKGTYEPTFAPSSLADWLSSRVATFDPASLAPSRESPFADLRKPIKLGPSLRSTASLLLHWSEASQNDLAMEVSPVRDEILLPPSASSSAAVTTFLWPETRWLESAESEWWNASPLEDRVFAPFYEHLRRIKAWGKVRPWRPETVEGALVLRNDLAFLDRRYDAPFAKLFPHARTESLSAFITRAGELGKKEDADLARFDAPWAPKGTIAFLPFARALAALDDPARRSLLQNLHTEAVAEVGLTGSARTAFAESFTAHALARQDFSSERLDSAALALNPSFRTNLIGAVLRIRFLDRQEDQANYLAEILVLDKKEGGLKPVLNARLEGMPLPKTLGRLLRRK